MFMPGTRLATHFPTPAVVVLGEAFQSSTVLFYACCPNNLPAGHDDLLVQTHPRAAGDQGQRQLLQALTIENSSTRLRTLSGKCWWA